jgi:uncharacterized protein (DUF1800 family)
MRLRLAAFLLILLSALPASALTFDEARHLLARTGFGMASRYEIERMMQFSQESAIEEVFGLMLSRPATQPPAEMDTLPPGWLDRKDLSPADRETLHRRIRDQGMMLKSWWWGEMLATDSPFTEHMVLFWHNHFTSSLQKVKWPGFLYRQNLLFRIHALGNYATLLREIARDPAMVVYLDTRTNRKDSPNENFARELFELFTLGEGRYTERDVKEAARAFTGWRLDAKSGEVIFDRRLHDSSPKVVLDQTVRTGDDVIRVILEQPRAAEHLVEKLWREFVSPSPDPDEVSHLSEILRESNWEMRPMMKALFALPHFWAPENRGTLVKSPVDIVAGTLRVMGGNLVPASRLPQIGRALGQDLFDPPNVRGWLGGEEWISAATAPKREQLLRRIARGREIEGKDPGFGAGFNPLAVDNPTLMPSLADLDREATPKAYEALRRLLLALPPVDSPRIRPGDGSTLRRVTLMYLLDPAFNVK